MRRADSFMPIGQNTSIEELVEAAAIELDEAEAARYRNFAYGLCRLGR